MKQAAPYLPQDILCASVLLQQQQQHFSNTTAAATTTSNSGMSSTCFNRAKIQHVLELLKLTQHKAWKDIFILLENLQACAEDGEIATDFPIMVLTTESEDGHE
jgi:hypothetical protein